MTAQGETTGPSSVWPALAVIIAVSVFTATLGIIYPYLTILLELRAFTPSFVGVNAAMVPIGLTIGSVLAPRIAMITGPYLMSLAAIAGSFVSLASLYLWYGYASGEVLPYLLMPLCVLLGVFINGLFVVGEAWINRLSPDMYRGRILGIYTTTLIAGYGVGPILLSLAKGSHPLIQGISLALLVAAALPLLAYRSTIARLTFERSSMSDGGVRDMLRFVVKAPYLVLCFASIAFFASVAMAMMPIFGTARGLDVTETSQILGALIIGGACFQPLIGALADRYPNRSVVLAFSIPTVALAYPIYRLEGAMPLTVVAFLWGGCAFATYTMALKELGDRFTGAPLLTGSAVLALAWGLTTIVGLPTTGVLLDGTSPVYLPLVLIVLYIPLILVSVRR